MSRRGLSDEQASFLASVYSSDFYAAIPNVLKSLAEDLEKALVSCESVQVSDRDLLIKKAKHEGALELIKKLEAHRKRFIKP